MNMEIINNKITTIDNKVNYDNFEEELRKYTMLDDFGDRIIYLSDALRIAKKNFCKETK
jgi:hypothetical protein